MESKNWGIFTKYDAPNKELNKWRDPRCLKCNRILNPWICWSEGNTFGFCTKCYKVFVVESTWELSPTAPVKAEIDEMVSQTIAEVQTEELEISIEELIGMHELIPIDKENYCKLLVAKAQLKTKNSSESILLQHLIWTLILNSSHIDAQQVREYINFIVYNRLSLDKRELWLAYQLDVVKKFYGDNVLEKTVIDEIYKIWMQKKKMHQPPKFDIDIELFILHYKCSYINYDIGFILFCNKIKKSYSFSMELNSFLISL
jgi:hypothetical protein